MASPWGPGPALSQADRGHTGGMISACTWSRGGREPDGGGEGARDLVTGAHLFPLESLLASSAREREAGTLSWESHRPTGEGLDPHTPSLAGFPSYMFQALLTAELGASDSQAFTP